MTRTVHPNSLASHRFNQRVGIVKNAIIQVESLALDRLVSPRARDQAKRSLIELQALFDLMKLDGAVLPNPRRSSDG